MIIAITRLSLLVGVLNGSLASLEDLYEKGKIQVLKNVRVDYRWRRCISKTSLNQKMNQSKVFVNYNKFVPPCHPHVPIDLKIDLTGVNKVEPANSFFDGNFLLRVKWQARGSSSFFLSRSIWLAFNCQRQSLVGSLVFEQFSTRMTQEKPV